MRETAGPRLFYVDEKMLITPAIAVAQVKNEIVNMADIALRNFRLSLHVICTLDDSEIERFRANEEELNFLNRELVAFLVKLSGTKLSAGDHAFISSAFHTVSDLERVGDYAENIVEYADSLRSARERFSPAAIQEIQELEGLIETLFGHVMRAYIHRDESALAEANQIEDKVDDLTRRMGENHIQRLSEGVCTPNVGAQYLSLSSNAERVADHFINVGRSIRRV